MSPRPLFPRSPILWLVALAIALFAVWSIFGEADTVAKVCSIEETSSQVIVKTTADDYMRNKSDGIPPELKKGAVLKIVYDGTEFLGGMYNIVRVEDPGGEEPLAECPASS